MTEISPISRSLHRGTVAVVLETRDGADFLILRHVIFHYYKRLGFKVYVYQSHNKYWLNMLARVASSGIAVLSTTQAVSARLTSQNITHRCLIQNKRGSTGARLLH